MYMADFMFYKKKTNTSVCHYGATPKPHTPLWQISGKLHFLKENATFAGIKTGTVQKEG